MVQHDAKLNSIIACHKYVHEKSFGAFLQCECPCKIGLQSSMFLPYFFLVHIKHVAIVTHNPNYLLAPHASQK